MNTYVYKDQTLLKQCKNQTEAAKVAQCAQTQVSIIMSGKQNKPTANGYYFSSKELSKEELDNIYSLRYNQACKQKYNNYEYEVSCQNPLVTYIPKSRKDKLKQLQALIWATNYHHWQQIPKYQANLEKVAYTELIESLM